MATATPMAPLPNPQPVSPQKKRPWRRWLGMAAIALFVLVGLFVWATPGLLAKSSYRNKLIADATADIDGTVKVGAVSLAWLHPVELHDVTIDDRSGRRILSAVRVRSEKTLFDLAMNRSDLGTIHIEKPVVDVVVEKGTTNVETAFAKILQAPVTDAPLRTALNLAIVDGTANFHAPDRSEHGTLDRIAAKVTIPASKAEAIALELSTEVNAEDRLQFIGSLGVTCTAKLEASGFDLARLSPLLHRFDVESSAAGTLTAKLSGSWTEAGRFEIDGTASTRDLALTGSWLNRDRLKLSSAELPLKLSYDAKRLSIDHAKLACDLGTASLAGTFDLNDLASLAKQPGIECEADLDLAKLAATVPNLLKLKPGTTLTGGRITAKLTSSRDAVPVWNGEIKTTPITGERDSRRLNWDAPLEVTFRGKLREDGTPTFETFTVQSDFIAAQARGELDSFVAAANVDLDKLSQKLNEFIDMAGWTLRGDGRNLIVQVQPDGDHSRLTLNGTLKNLVITSADTVWFDDKLLTIGADVRFRSSKDGGWRIDRGTVQAKADKDELDIELLAPIDDHRAMKSGKAKVTLLGDLGRWRARLGRLVAVPKEWEIAGEAKPATAIVDFGDDIVLREVQVVVLKPVFSGAGIDFREPDVRLETADPKRDPKLKPGEVGAITINRSGGIAFDYTTVACRSFSLAAKRFELTKANGEYGAKGTANIVALVDHVQRMLQLPANATEADEFRGVATGAIAIDAPNFRSVGFKGDLLIEHVSYGSKAKPILLERWIKLKADGTYSTAADGVTLSSLEMSREGWAIRGKGNATKLTSTIDLDLAGDLAYDLAKMETELQKILGSKTAKVAGTGERPFRVAGSLKGGGENLAMDVGRLDASAGLNWTSLKAYGFDVGEAELKAKLDRGLLTTNAIRAGFGGGTISIEPTVKFDPKGNVLAAKPGEIVKKGKLTQAACAEALGYALPAIANSTQAEGTFSFDLRENRLPLNDPSKSTASGTLTIHEATVAPGPIVTQLVEAIGLNQPKLQLSKGNAVPIDVKNGRVYHRDFLLNLGGTPVTSAGSVGFDGTVEVNLTVPVGGAIAEKLVPNRPLIQKLLAKQSIIVPIGGTMAKPELNREALRGTLGKILEVAVKDAAKETGQGAIDDVLKKGLEGLLKPKK